MEKTSFETSTFIDEVTKALSSYYTDSLNYYINSDEDFLSYTPQKFKHTALHFSEQILILAIKNMPEFSLPFISVTPSYSKFWKLYDVKSPKQQYAIRSYFESLRTLTLNHLDEFKLYYTPLYCLQWLLDNISNLKEIPGFSPKKDFKILLHFIMEAISSHSFNTEELKSFNNFWDVYLQCYDSDGENLNKVLVKLYQEIPFYEYITPEHDLFPLLEEFVFSNMGFFKSLSSLSSSSTNFMTIYHAFAITDEFKDATPYNMLLDYARDHLFYKALYSIYRTYRPNTFTVSKYVNDRADYITGSDLKEHARLFSNNFSKLLAEKDVTKVYSYNSKAKSPSNFNKISFFNPLPEDTYYFDLLLFSLKLRGPRSSNDDFESDDYIKNFEFRKNLQLKIKDIIFRSKQYNDSYPSLCGLYFNLLSGSKIDVSGISSNFIKCINTCIKYMYDNSRGTDFGRINFYYNNLATEWRYYQTVTELYNAKDQMFNEFLMTLKQVSCNDIRLDILNQKDTFYNLFVRNKDLFCNYATMIDIMYKVMCSILMTLLKLPVSFVSKDVIIPQSTLNYMEKFFRDPYYNKIDITDYSIKPAKYKSLSNLIEIEQNIKIKN